MKRIFFLFVVAFAAILSATLLFSCASSDIEDQNASDERRSLTQYVDPLIGSGEHGHVFVGANVPFGMVQLGPTNHSTGWDWCSGYHISDSTIIGFGHMHLSGTGIGDLGDISVMPVLGNVPLQRGDLSDPTSGIYSLFSHERETVRPGYYSVHLDRFGIDVELTATRRVGFHKYRFPASDTAQILFDLEHGIGWDSPVEGAMVQENDTVVSGYRYSSGWAKDQRIYFVAHLSKPMKGFSFTKEATEKSVSPYGQLFFDTQEGETIYMKVALSPVSVENAKMNMRAELPDWDFTTTVQRADEAWNAELKKIDVKMMDESSRRIFYTALYHTMVAPSIFCDVNNDYWGTDKQLHAKASFTNYTTFSLWDTYRAAHPLMSIIHPEKMSDFIQTMLHIYQEQGKLPVWHLVGNETDCMVGNPGISVVADAILKGFGGFDHAVAYEAMKQSALLDERGQKWMKELGYIPFDKEKESLAMAMEYAIADWSVAEVAQRLGYTDDVDTFKRMSETYKHYFDPETRFMRGKDSKGRFRTPFDPFHSDHRENDYTEGTAWQYTWLVPHDVEGLVSLFGSKEAFLEKLDSLFIVSGDMGKDASPDISGLIGQYAHGNEPSHHVLYLYSCVGEPKKSAEKVREVLTRLYTDQPEGLCGNEDVGQMSAWYILSSLGFYQVEPAGGRYYFGSPLVEEAVIDVGDGKRFRIKAKDNSKENIYIQSVTLNGLPYDKGYIDFADIQSGGLLEFQMTNE